ncbi:MAG: serine hydrolase domain-containing protein [Cellulophaga sp.]
MKNFFCFLINLLILTSCSNQSEKDKKFLDERISRIENGLQSNLQIKYGDSVSIQYYNIEERMKELGIPGVSIAVMNNGVIEWAKGYGMADSSENRNVTIETLFQAGSISKPVAATRALQLAEKGIINIDSNVNDYLTSWKLPDNKFTKKEKVTTRRMLNHSAGLTVWGFPGYAKGDTIPSIAEILDGKRNTDSVRVYKEPGESWQYSGGGYTIMQLMITDIEQKQFPEIMQEYVLDPLGMTSSTYANPLPKKYHNLAATGYYNDGTAVKGKWHTYPEMAAAGLWTTPSQLVLWSKEIQQILQTQKDGLLKAQTVNEMLIENRGNQGLGPYVLEHTFGHGGADEGFRADLMAWKETPISVAMMSNSDNGSNIFREIFLSISQEYNLQGIEPRTRVFKEQSQKELARFIGKYHFPENGDAKIVIKDNGLEFTGEIFSDPIFLLPETDNTFFNKNTGTYYTFQFERGSITSVKFSRFEAKKIE